MSKPVFVVADTDSDYLETIEMKLLEELGDDIELHTISDKTYFEQYFSESHNACVIIVSEELYSGKLHKQNADNIILLTDDINADDTENINAYKICKYTNINDIFNKITAIALGGALEGIPINNKGNIVLIGSAAGGVGNTTLALGLSYCLSKRYKRVLYIDAEEMNTFQYMTKKDAFIKSDTASRISNDPQNAFGIIKDYIEKEHFEYIPPFFSPLISIGLDTSIYENIIRNAKASGEYDVIIVDMGAGIDLLKASLMTYADKVLFITNQSRASGYAMDTFLKNINYNDNDKYYIVCNDFNESQQNALRSYDFIVNEYVRHIDGIEEKAIDEIGEERDIEKLSFIIA